MEEDIEKYNEEVDKQNRQIEEKNEELAIWLDDITSVLKELINSIQRTEESKNSKGFSKWKEDFVERLKISNKFKEYLME